MLDNVISTTSAYKVHSQRSSNAPPVVLIDIIMYYRIQADETNHVTPARKQHCNARLFNHGECQRTRTEFSSFQYCVYSQLSAFRPALKDCLRSWWTVIIDRVKNRYNDRSDNQYTNWNVRKLIIPPHKTRWIFSNLYKKSHYRTLKNIDSYNWFK